MAASRISEMNESGNKGNTLITEVDRNGTTGNYSPIDNPPAEDTSSTRSRQAVHPSNPAGFLANRKRELDQKGIGNGGEDYNLLIGLPWSISPEEFTRLQNSGETFSEMLTIANKLYAEAVGSPSRISQLSEGGLSDDARTYQRSFYESREQYPPPMFFRADMLDLETAVELNIPGGGHGLMESITSTTSENKKFGIGLARGWAEGLRDLSGKHNPRVHIPVYNTRTEPQERYFAKILQSMGIQVSFYMWSAPLPSPKDADIVFRFGLNSSIKKKGWPELWEAYLSGDVKIEPPPTSLYDSKIGHLLPFIPEVADRFPDAVRDLFPPTWLVSHDTEVPILEKGMEKMMAVDDIPYLGQKQREFVLKYAGADPSIYGAGKAVYQLDGKRTGRHGAEELLIKALYDWDNSKNPWMLQPRLKVPHEVTYLDPSASRRLTSDSMRARIMPNYRQTDTGIELIGGSALFSKKWKVHGQSDSVHCAIQVV